MQFSFVSSVSNGLLVKSRYSSQVMYLSGTSILICCLSPDGVSLHSLGSIPITALVQKNIITITTITIPVKIAINCQSPLVNLIVWF